MLQKRVFKFGCNWEANANSFKEFIHDHGIVIGRANRTPFDIGDLVLICEGFQVRAIVEVRTEPVSIQRRPELSVMTDRFGVAIEPATIVADANWKMLEPHEQFEYELQNGACRVRKREIVERANELWSKS